MSEITATLHTISGVMIASSAMADDGNNGDKTKRRAALSERHFLICMLSIIESTDARSLCPYPQIWSAVWVLKRKFEKLLTKDRTNSSEDELSETTRAAILKLEMKAHLLWDLDGTLTDPRLGILTCIRHALTKFGRPLEESLDLRWCIGPPLHETFKVLVPNATPEQVLELVALYRERFSVTGLFENSVFPEIPNLLSDAKSLGLQNYLATSKPHVFDEPREIRNFLLDRTESRR